MSGPSTYNPKSGFEKWIDTRLPLPRLAVLLKWMTSP